MASSSGHDYSVEFNKSGTANTTETLSDDALWHAQGVRSRRHTLTNRHGTISLLWRTDADTTQKILRAGESISINARTKRVFLEAASSTVVYDLWGWG